MEIALAAAAGAALLAIGPMLLGAMADECRPPADTADDVDDVLDLYPAPFGQSAATFMLGSAAAPVLAGFSVALIGLVLQAPGELEFSSVALLLLVSAALLLIIAQQYVLRAQRVYVSPDQWAAWMTLVSETRKRYLRGELEDHLTRHEQWIDRAEVTFNAGIFVLLVGVAFALVPDVDAFHEIPEGRLAASVVALLGGVAELGWVVYDRQGEDPD